MRDFFAKLGSALTTFRVWAVNILTLIVVIYLVVVVAAVLNRAPDPVDPEGRVLIINPAGIVLEQEAFPSEFNFPPDMSEERQIQSRDLVEVIRAAAADRDPRRPLCGPPEGIHGIRGHPSCVYEK